MWSRRLGDECIMFASDYPHWDGAWPHATTELLEHDQRRGCPDSALARVAGANARGFYRLPARPTAVGGAPTP